MMTAYKNWLVIFSVAIGLACSTSLAEDLDGDGVDRTADVCTNTPSGVLVDAEGRPIGDLDEDCDVDLADAAIMHACFTGAFSCPPEVCDGSDNDCNGLIDDMGTLTCGIGACLRQVEACANGVPQTCVPGDPAPEDCTDGTDNDCDGAADCRDSACEAAPCDDGLYCTDGDTCVGGTCTGGAPVDCSHLDDGCTRGVCNEGINACEVSNIADGFGCDDGNDCTIGETCSSGECAGTSLPDEWVCDDGDPQSDQSLCVIGECVATTTYVPSGYITYSCSATGLSFRIQSFEFAHSGDLLAVFGAPAAMFDPDGIESDGSFYASGSITDGACTQTYWLDAQFSGPTWTGTFGAEFVGCGSCGWPTWSGLGGTPE
ncbi:MAG: hypothetical protein ACYTFA_04365 [Planctomycetota bacterium]|jgi:hypothetical protein